MANVYTVRMEDGEIEVQSLEALVSLARQGQIGRATMVRTQDSDWGEAELIPEVAAVLTRDPWAAWQEQSGDGEDLLKKFERPDLPEPPRASAPQPPLVEDLPASAVSPMDEEPLLPGAVPPGMAPPAEPSVRRPHGEVIEFPGGRGPSTVGSHALDTQAPRRAPRQEAEPAKASKSGGIFYHVNWLRMSLIGAIGVGGTLMWVWYIHTTSTAQFTHKPPKLQPPVVTTQVQPLLPSAPVSPYAEIEESLRTQLMEPILDIAGEEQFEDALHIELRRVRLDVAWVRVKIESWAGRKKDVPQDVRFQVRLRGKSEAIDRDLGALGLVLGKYVQHYGIEARDIHVLIEDQDAKVREVKMNPDVARRFFTNRMSLEEFLQQAFQAKK
jgi:hypothetical protein